MTEHDYDYWAGETRGDQVFLADQESEVLGPDGEPLRKAHRWPIGFDLSKRSKGARQ